MQHLIVNMLAVLGGAFACWILALGACLAASMTLDMRDDMRLLRWRRDYHKHAPAELDPLALDPRW